MMLHFFFSILASFLMCRVIEEFISREIVKKFISNFYNAIFALTLIINSTKNPLMYFERTFYSLFNRRNVEHAYKASELTTSDDIWYGLSCVCIYKGRMSLSIWANFVWKTSVKIKTRKINKKSRFMLIAFALFAIFSPLSHRLFHFFFFDGVCAVLMSRVFHLSFRSLSYKVLIFFDKFYFVECVPFFTLFHDHIDKFFFAI